MTIKACEGCRHYHYLSETRDEPEEHECDIGWTCSHCICEHFYEEGFEDTYRGLCNVTGDACEKRTDTQCTYHCSEVFP